MPARHGVARRIGRNVVGAPTSDHAGAERRCRRRWRGRRSWCPAPRRPTRPERSRRRATEKQTGPTSPATSPSTASTIAGGAGGGLTKRSDSEPADDRCDESPGVVSATASVSDAPAVAQHGDPVGDAEDLVQPMGHIDDAEASARRRRSDVEQAGDVGFRQRRGRLVEHQQVGIRRPWRGRCATIERSAAGRSPTRASGSMPPPMRRKASRAASRARPPGDQPAAARIAGEHRDVLGDRHACRRGRDPDG